MSDQREIENSASGDDSTSQEFFDVQSSTSYEEAERREDELHQTSTYQEVIWDNLDDDVGSDEFDSSEQSGQESTEGGASVVALTQILEIPLYTTPRSKTRDQQKAADWIGAGALAIWKAQRDARLAAWGVGPEHHGTCVLVPHDWRALTPSSLLEDIRRDITPQSEPDTARLMFTLFDTTVSWARASAFFAGQRRGVDLDVFLSTAHGPYPEMHGSHTCHHGLCINPHHITFEPKPTNMSRVKCLTASRRFRQYDDSCFVPSHCKEHNPPCLLQHASLTTVETIYIQFNVLRTAMGLPPPHNPPQQPIDHPTAFNTFEYSLPVHLRTNGASIITAPRHKLVTPSEPTASGKRPFYCRFCQRHRTWTLLDHFWSHVKLKHNDISENERLEEIKAQTSTYLDWLDDMGYDYSSSHPRIWALMQQTRLPDFTWAVFTSWHLHADSKSQFQAEYGGR